MLQPAWRMSPPLSQVIPWYQFSNSSSPADVAGTAVLYGPSVVSKLFQRLCLLPGKSSPGAFLSSDTCLFISLVFLASKISLHILEQLKSIQIKLCGCCSFCHFKSIQNMQRPDRLFCSNTAWSSVGARLGGAAAAPPGLQQAAR